MRENALGEELKRNSLAEGVLGLVGRKLELVFIDKDGKWYPLDEVTREELAAGLEKISKETAKRLQLLKEQR
jgi:hypothetical protein